MVLNVLYFIREFILDYYIVELIKCLVSGDWHGKKGQWYTIYKGHVLLNIKLLLCPVNYSTK